MLRLGPLDESRKSHALEVIERNAEMQARLIEDLDVSRIAAGQLRLHVEAIALHRVVAAAIDAVRPAAESKSLRVSWSMRVTSPMYGDPARLQQVVLEPPDERREVHPGGGTIAVDAAEEAGAVRIAVADSGEGIPKHFRSRLFDTSAATTNTCRSRSTSTCSCRPSHGFEVRREGQKPAD